MQPGTETLPKRLFSGSVHTGWCACLEPVALGEATGGSTRGQANPLAVV